MKNQDIVFTGLQDWNMQIGGNAKNIARVMSQQNRVLYVNPPQGFRGGVNKTHKEPLQRINERLYTLDLNFHTLPANSFRWDWMFDALNKFNNKKIARAILHATKELGFKDFVLFNDNDIFRSFYLKEFLDPTVSVYYRRDWLQGVDYWKRHSARLEPILAAKSDLVLANSPYLLEDIKGFNPESYYVGQGVDLSLYDPHKKHLPPEDLQSVAKPIVGYVGAVSSLRLDADLLYELAKNMREVSFVVVGPEDDFFKSHRLHILGNVHFLGAKTPERLPAYIAHFDVCINPQLLNPTTQGNYPRKIDEYLAMGKAVVATRTPTMEIFESVVSLCENHQQYIQAIRLSLSLDNDALRSERIAFAQSHSWKNSVEAIYRAIAQIRTTKQ